MPWEPQPGPQSSALLADWCSEVFYGGERGGGKSDFQVGYQEDGALRYADHWRGIMFRKTYPEMEELQSRATEIFRASGAVFKSQPSADYPFSNCWYWPSGASVKMRYIEREADYGRYHGHSYTGISFDEVTEYATPAPLLKMASTLRSAHGVPCTMRLTGNPGGIGHAWVKARYIDVGAPNVPYTDPETGFTRMFIRSRLDDNQILMRSDPSYRQRLLAATDGNETLRKAWLDGDWDIVAGAFFEVWSREHHVIQPFDLPAHWVRFRSMDWGSARPFSVGWWAMVGETFRTPDGHTLPRGYMLRYREWYGASAPNVGLKMHAEEVGAGIWAREQKDPKMAYGVLDPAAFSQDGGPSIAERIYKGSGSKITFRRADNKRVRAAGAMGGWDQMRGRLIGEDGLPMIGCFSTCVDSIRTLPAMQHDINNIEDMDSDGEDHAADEWRYACMSRPYSRPAPLILPMRGMNEMTLNELWDAQKKRNRTKARV